MERNDECDTLELEAETALACYEDNWHVAVNDCADTGEPSQYWMNGGEPFSIDRFTRRLILPGVFEMSYAPEDDDGNVQGRTYWGYVFDVGRCHAMGLGLGPVLGPHYAAACIRTVDFHVVRDCEFYQNDEHCWW